jgi:hypothetical protein
MIFLTYLLKQGTIGKFNGQVAHRNTKGILHVMNNEIKLSDLNGWHVPSNPTGLEDVNYWLFGLALPAFRRIPAWLSFGGAALLVIGAVISFTQIFFVQPQMRVEAVQNNYLNWFHKHYDYLGINDTEAKEIMDNNGYLDVDARRHYILVADPNEKNVEYVYYLSANSEYAYKAAPQDLKSPDKEM